MTLRTDNQTSGSPKGEFSECQSLERSFRNNCLISLPSGVVCRDGAVSGSSHVCFHAARVRL